MDRLTPWKGRKPMVGVIHLPPLPGSPGWEGSMAPVLERAVGEAVVLEEMGLDGVLVENFQDAPFYPDSSPPETIAAMTLVVGTVRRKVEIPVGVNLLRNDAQGALAVAAVTGGSFIRVNVHTGSMFTDQGLIQGRAHDTLRRRRFLGTSVAILADVLVKHATPPPGTVLETAARDAWHRGLADGLILTGSETGARVDPADVARVKDALPPEGKVWVGSGTTPESVRELIRVADGIIVGSSLREGGRPGAPLDSHGVANLLAAAGRG